MVFEYKRWDEFCKNLYDAGIVSIPACEVKKESSRYLVLKHDVETDVPRAFKLAKIESDYGHRGSYYVQAYLMNNPKNIDFLKKMQEFGHEISYHYDVMDSNKGNVQNAIVEFERKRKIFEDNGFHIVTVCQHGNPVIERRGYTSNRDFFRNRTVQELYPSIADIMVDYKDKYKADYTYYSDAGRKFSKIFDPINNDRISSDNKNLRYKDLNEVFHALKAGENAILSIHPHRWTKSALEYTIKSGIFRVLKGTAKILIQIPGIKKLMGRYYYLAKKI